MSNRTDDRKNEEQDTERSTAAQGKPSLRDEPPTLLNTGLQQAAAASLLRRLPPADRARLERIARMIYELRTLGVDPHPYFDRAQEIAGRSMLSVCDALKVEVDRARKGLEPSTDVMDKKKA